MLPNYKGLVVIIFNVEATGRYLQCFHKSTGSITSQLFLFLLLTKQQAALDPNYLGLQAPHILGRT